MPEGRDGEQAPDAARTAPGAVHSQSGTPTVFISYASSDRGVADSVCAALERAGVKCWIAPRDVTPGEFYAESIAHAIDSAKVIVLVLSQNAAVSQHVLREVERTSSKRHPMVPFRIDLAPLPAGLEYFLSTSQWLDASATGVDRALPTLVDAVRGALAHPSAVARVSPDPSVTTRARRRPSRMLIALALIVATVSAYVAVDKFWLSKRVDQQKPTVAATPASPVSSSVTAAIPNKSIAVLPFADMSPKKDQEYMSDGMAEELLNLLAQVPDLKVIARTSSFAFKGQNVDIAEIAKKLNVAHVLEGSVRTAGNKLRITVQLIRAADSTHIWSEKYDRSLDDIFAVQDEIASAVAQALQIKLDGGSLSHREGGTQNLEAYKLYLRANIALNENTLASLDAAKGYAERAVTLDRNFGKAWDALSVVSALMAEDGSISAREGHMKSRELARHALQVSPDLVSARARLAYILFVFDWNWAAAEAEFQRTLSMDPTSSSALNGAGRLSTTLGRWGEAEQRLRSAQVRDPLDPFVILNLAHMYYLAGRFSESERTFRELLVHTPNFGWTRAFLGKTLLVMGKPQEALAVVQEDTDERNRSLYLPQILQACGKQNEADQALKEQIRLWTDTAAFYVAQTYAYRGQNDLAMEWLERAYRQKDAALVEIVGEHMFKGLAKDPRYKAFLRKMKLPE